jgi:hypothetical protein
MTNCHYWILEKNCIFVTEIKTTMIESMDNNEGTQKSKRKSGGTPVLDNFSERPN